MSNHRRLLPEISRHLRESATAVAEHASTTLLPLAESSADGVTGAGLPRRYRARLIEADVWGSSGFYDRDVVARDGPVTWPVGTQMFIDHPAASDEYERPERSIRDIGAYITSTPVCEADGLYADIEVVPHHAALVHSLRNTIGLSIRADGLAESGTRQGRTGPVVTAITRGHSVDFVTKAGAGGKIVSLLEAARERGFSETPAAAPVDGAPTTTDVTDGTPPTGSPNTPKEEPDMSGTTTGGQPGQAGTAPGVDTAAIQIEAREAATARDRAVSERDTALREAATANERAARAEAELARYQAVDAARPLVAAQLAEAGLPSAAQNRITAGVTQRVPLTEAGLLDQHGLRTLVDAEVAAEKTYLAQLQESSGVGRVAGFGQPVQPAAKPATSSWLAPAVEPNAALVEAYKDRGLTAEAALAAARGRAI